MLVPLLVVERLTMRGRWDGRRERVSWILESALEEEAELVESVSSLLLVEADSDVSELLVELV